MAGTFNYAYVKFYESDLEEIAMDVLSGDEFEMGYIYCPGSELHREQDEVLIIDDFYLYLIKRYPDLSDTEIAKIEARVRATENTLYETNRAFLRLLADGFDIKRDDPSKSDIHIELADYENLENNTFRVVNQFEVKQRQLRIPDAVVFLNGLPVVVFEFKNPANDIADTHAAYEQVAVRYARDIPRLMSYNAFTILSDGVNSKYGSIFAPYKFFNTWRQVEEGDKETQGVEAFYTLIEGLLRKTACSPW